MAENTEKRESPSGQDTTKKMAKKLKTARQKLTESFKSSALKEFYREKYKNNRRNKSFERNKLHRRHSPTTSSLEDLFRSPDDNGTDSSGNKQDDAEQKLRNLCKDAKLTLLYFEAIVSKNITEQYSASASKILETVSNIVDQLSQSTYSAEQSNVLVSCRSRVAQTVADLILWSDTSLLQSGKHTHEHKPIQDIVKSVQSALDELVDKSIEKIHSHTNNSAPVTPMKALKPPWPTSDEGSSPLFAPPKPPLPSNRIPPLPPKQRHSTGSKPIGYVKPFNPMPDAEVPELGLFGVEGLTKSEESLLDHNNQKMNYDLEIKNCMMFRQDRDRSSVCSSNLGSDVACDDNLSEAAMVEMDRIMQDSLPDNKGSIASDGDYVHWREEGMSNGQQERPVSDSNVLMPISFSSSTNFMEDCPDGETPPALPVKQSRHSLLSKHLSQVSQFSIGSADSVEMTSSSQEDEDEKPPPLPIKQKTIQAYMQMFSDSQPPPMAEIARQTAKRYQFPGFANDTPPNGPMRAVYQPTMDTQSTYSTGSLGRHRDSVSSMSSVTSGYSSSSSPATATAPPPALPPKVRRSTMESHTSYSTRSSVSSEQELINDVAEKEPPLPVKIKPMLLPDKQTVKSFKNEKKKRVEKDIEDIVDPGDLMDRTEVLEWIVFKKSKEDRFEIKAGCVDALIVYAAEANKKNLLYYEAFLTTYRSFITPMELLEKLLHRYKKFGQNSSENNREQKRASRNSFFLLLRVVDELSLIDITDEILNTLMELVYQLLCDANLMLAKLLRTKVLSKHQHRLSNLTDSILAPLASLSVSSKVMKVLDFSSERLAEQMTLLDLELFQKIEIPEVLQWAKEQSEEMSPHLTAFTDHFNKMSFWTRTLILKQERPQDRERLLNKFIRIMRHLRRLNNFNSYLAILSALDSAPVRRLEWQKQTTEGLREYCQLIDSSSSFRTYREALAEASPPCIPYLGLILQDLTFIHLGNQDELAPGVINFSKRWQQFNILDSMRCFKQSQYPFEKDQNIVDMFDNFNDHLAEDALWELSLKIKARVRRPRRPHPPPNSERPESTVTNDSTATEDTSAS